ncbi:MAG: ATP synthase subunit I [Defluviitaleaceae bacterium]|nr:ATP synthase subunit I [Defluviitaleaceae bacterium]
MKLSNTGKGLIKGVIILSATGFAIGAFFVPNVLFYAVGIGIGAAISVLKTILLERSVNKVMEAEKKSSARNAMRMGYMSRHLLTALVLFAAVYFLELSGLIGAFVGTLALTLSAYFIKFFGKEGKEAS